MTSEGAGHKSAWLQATQQQQLPAAMQVSPDQTHGPHCSRRPHHTALRTTCSHCNAQHTCFSAILAGSAISRSPGWSIATSAARRLSCTQHRPLPPGTPFPSLDPPPFVLCRAGWRCPAPVQLCPARRCTCATTPMAWPTPPWSCFHPWSPSSAPWVWVL